MRPSLAAILATMLVTACSGDPQPVHEGSASSMEINRRGADVYGTAGPGWSDAEVQQGLNAGTVCNNNERVRNLRITRDSSGTVSFTGTCAK